MTTKINPETDPLTWLQVDPTTSPPSPMSIDLCFSPARWDTDSSDGPALSVSLRHQTDGTPEAIYHGRILRWGLSSLTDAVRFTEAINRGDLDHLFERIAAGHTIEWDGSNHIGHMTEDAATAFYAVDDAVTDWLFFQCELTGKNAGLWDAGDWLSEYGYEAIAEDHNLLIPVSDEELATVADALDAEARREQIVLCGTYEWLKKEAQ